jgi:methionyl-tRNA formyltransferase
MRLAFMGSPDFSTPALRALHAAGHEIAAVYCQPPKPAGRGYALRPCPVQIEAERLALPVRTPADRVTYAPKLTREAGRIDWTRDSAAIERQVHAFDPWPGTFTTLRGTVLKVLAVELAHGSGPPGTALDDRLTIGCRTEALRLTRVQLAGRPAMAADVFLRGHAVPAGTALGD